MLDPKLTNKRTLITGGATGLGLGIALALANEGTRLVIASRNPEEFGLDQLRATAAEIHPLCADVSTEAGAIKMVAEATRLLGGLDLYVNNAAVSAHEPVTGITAAAFNRVFETNTLGAVYACREAARTFVAQRSGGILILGSTARMTPTYGELAYRLSKTGLKVLVESLALELAPFGVRANLLTPGHFPTPRTETMAEKDQAALKQEIPLRCFGDPSHDLGATALLLLSDYLSPFTTGTEFVVDGGLSLRPVSFWDDETIHAFNSPTT